MSAGAPQPASVDPGAYRQAIGRFAAGVAVVTSVLRGHDVALTIDSLTSISLDPVLLLVSLHPEARVLEGVQDGAAFGVSILTARQRGVAEWLGEPGRPLHHQLVGVAHHRGESTGTALLDDALATFECRAHTVVEAGDHTLVIGQVCRLQASPSDQPALVHYRGQLHQLS